jgi:hypothetical protein
MLMNKPAFMTGFFLRRRHGAIAAIVPDQLRCRELVREMA